MTTPVEKLREYGYELPVPSAPVATYIPVTRTGNIIYVSGQISRTEGGVITGLLGDTMNVVQGGNAAELAAVNFLSQIVYSAGVDLTKVKRVLTTEAGAKRLGGHAEGFAPWASTELRGKNGHTLTITATPGALTTRGCVVGRLICRDVNWKAAE